MNGQDFLACSDEVARSSPNGKARKSSILKKVLLPITPRAPLKDVTVGYISRKVSFASVNSVKEFCSEAESVNICNIPSYEESFSQDSSQSSNSLAVSALDMSFAQPNLGEDEMDISIEDNDLKLNNFPPFSNKAEIEPKRDGYQFTTKKLPDIATLMNKSVIVRNETLNVNTDNGMEFNAHTNIPSEDKNTCATNRFMTTNENPSDIFQTELYSANESDLELTASIPRKIQDNKKSRQSVFVRNTEPEVSDTYEAESDMEFTAATNKKSFPPEFSNITTRKSYSAPTFDSSMEVTEAITIPFNAYNNQDMQLKPPKILPRKSTFDGNDSDLSQQSIAKNNPFENSNQVEEPLATVLPKDSEENEIDKETMEVMDNNVKIPENELDESEMDFTVAVSKKSFPYNFPNQSEQFCPNIQQDHFILNALDDSGMELTVASTSRKSIRPPVQEFIPIFDAENQAKIVPDVGRISRKSIAKFGDSMEVISLKVSSAIPIAIEEAKENIPKERILPRVSVPFSVYTESTSRATRDSDLPVRVLEGANKAHSNIESDVNPKTIQLKDVALPRKSTIVTDTANVKGIAYEIQEAELSMDLKLPSSFAVNPNELEDSAMKEANIITETQDIPKEGTTLPRKSVPFSVYTDSTSRVMQESDLSLDVLPRKSAAFTEVKKADSDHEPDEINKVRNISILELKEAILPRKSVPNQSEPSMEINLPRAVVVNEDELEDSAMEVTNTIPIPKDTILPRKSVPFCVYADSASRTIQDSDLSLDVLQRKSNPFNISAKAPAEPESSMEMTSAIPQLLSRKSVPFNTNAKASTEPESSMEFTNAILPSLSRKTGAFTPTAYEPESSIENTDVIPKLVIQQATLPNQAKVPAVIPIAVNEHELEDSAMEVANSPKKSVPFSVYTDSSRAWQVSDSSLDGPTKKSDPQQESSIETEDVIPNLGIKQATLPKKSVVINQAKVSAVIPIAVNPHEVEDSAMEVATLPRKSVPFSVYTDSSRTMQESDILLMGPARKSDVFTGSACEPEFSIEATDVIPNLGIKQATLLKKSVVFNQAKMPAVIPIAVNPHEVEDSAMKVATLPRKSVPFSVYTDSSRAMQESDLSLNIPTRKNDQEPESSMKTQDVTPKHEDATLPRKSVPFNQGVIPIVMNSHELESAMEVTNTIPEDDAILPVLPRKSAFTDIAEVNSGSEPDSLIEATNVNILKVKVKSSALPRKSCPFNASSKAREESDSSMEISNIIPSSSKDINKINVNVKTKVRSSKVIPEFDSAVGGFLKISTPINIFIESTPKNIAEVKKNPKVVPVNLAQSNLDAHVRSKIVRNRKQVNSKIIPDSDSSVETEEVTEGRCDFNPSQSEGTNIIPRKYSKCNESIPVVPVEVSIVREKQLMEVTNDIFPKGFSYKLGNSIMDASIASPDQIRSCIKPHIPIQNFNKVGLDDSSFEIIKSTKHKPSPTEAMDIPELGIELVTEQVRNVDISVPNVLTNFNKRRSAVAFENSPIRIFKKQTKENAYVRMADKQIYNKGLKKTYIHDIPFEVRVKNRDFMKLFGFQRQTLTNWFAYVVPQGRILRLGIQVPMVELDIDDPVADIYFEYNPFMDSDEIGLYLAKTIEESFPVKYLKIKCTKIKDLTTILDAIKNHVNQLDFIMRNLYHLRKKHHFKLVDDSIIITQVDVEAKLHFEVIINLKNKILNGASIRVKNHIGNISESILQNLFDTLKPQDAMLYEFIKSIQIYVQTLKQH